MACMGSDAGPHGLLICGRRAANRHAPPTIRRLLFSRQPVPLCVGAAALPRACWVCTQTVPHARRTIAAGIGQAGPIGKAGGIQPILPSLRETVGRGRRGRWVACARRMDRPSRRFLLQRHLLCKPVARPPGLGLVQPIEFGHAAAFSVDRCTSSLSSLSLFQKCMHVSNNGAWGLAGCLGHSCRDLPLLLGTARKGTPPHTRRRQRPTPRVPPPSGWGYGFGRNPAAGTGPGLVAEVEPLVVRPLVGRCRRAYDYSTDR